MSKTVADIREDVEKGHSASVTTDQKPYWLNQKKSYLLVKRIFDIVVSVVAGSVLLLPMAIIGLLIVLESPGPAIYKQERLGKNGKPFNIYKFRSMHLDAEKNGPQWAATEDPRCTKIGKFIRRWHIDELPQLLNVLKGEMSIVGPRPERECFYEIFKKDLPNYSDRMLVDQGLTCIGQVRLYDAELTPENKIACDIEYIQKQSVATDIVCILKTFGAIFRNKGA